MTKSEETGIPCPHCEGPWYVGDDAPLADRLRYWHRHVGDDEYGEAADEIERLRSVLTSAFNSLLCSDINQPRSEIATRIFRALNHIEP